MAQIQVQRFEQVMADHLRSRFPAAGFVNDPRQLHAFVKEGIELAKSFGVVNQFDLRRFLEFRAEYGVSFHDLPWASRILKDPSLSGCGKMEQIDDYSLFVVRPGNE